MLKQNFHSCSLTFNCFIQWRCISWRGRQAGHKLGKHCRYDFNYKLLELSRKWGQRSRGLTQCVFMPLFKKLSPQNCVGLLLHQMAFSGDCSDKIRRRGKRAQCSFIPWKWQSVFSMWLLNMMMQDTRQDFCAFSFEWVFAPPPPGGTCPWPMIHPGLSCRLISQALIENWHSLLFLTITKTNCQGRQRITTRNVRPYNIVTAAV